MSDSNKNEGGQSGAHDKSQPKGTKRLGFLGTTIVTGVSLVGLGAVALPRIDADSELGRSLSSIPLAGDNLQGGDTVVASNEATSDDASNADESTSEASDLDMSTNEDPEAVEEAAAEETVEDGEALVEEVNEAVDEAVEDNATDAPADAETETTDEAAGSEGDQTDAAAVEEAAAEDTVEDGEALVEQVNEAVDVAVVDNATDETANADDASDDGAIVEEAVAGTAVAASAATTSDADPEAADEDEAVEAVADESADATTDSAEGDEDATTDETVSADADSGAASDTEALASENDQLKSQIAELEAQLESTQSQTSDVTKSAEQIQKEKAIADMKLAILGGASVEQSLNELTEAGIEIPEVLKSDLEQVPSAIDLQNSFGGHATNAIRASMLAQEGTGIFHGITTRVKAEYVGRSLTPQTGASPDAVLSRAEDALRNGDLQGSLSEISVLPSEAQDAMKPWTDQANARLDVLKAIADMANQIEQN